MKKSLEQVGRETKVKFPSYRHLSDREAGLKVMKQGLWVGPLLLVLSIAGFFLTFPHGFNSENSNFMRVTYFALGGLFAAVFVVYFKQLKEDYFDGVQEPVDDDPLGIRGGKRGKKNDK